MNENDKKKKDESIGFILKSKREELGLSIDDVKSKSRLAAKIIIALENDKYDELPKSYYLLHLKRYATILKLDYKNLKKKYLLLEKHPKDVYTFEVRHPKKYNESSKKGVVYAVLFIVIILVIAIAINNTLDNISNSNKNLTNIVKDTILELQELKKHRMLTDTLLANSTKDTLVVNDKKSKMHRLEFDLRDKSWIRLKYDDHKEEDHVFQKGQREYWDFRDSIVFSIGRASKVDIYLDGKKYDKSSIKIKGDVIHNHKIKMIK